MATRGDRWASTGFFVWILLVHTVGLYFFAKGFLLSRRVLDSSSTCTHFPLSAFQSNESYHVQFDQDGCWMPRSFDKAVILVIDALRYDFTVPHAPQASGKSAHQPFNNALTILHETATQEPQNAVLFPFIADPPTTTLQRLKGLTTGTLPTFIEAGANFAGSALLEDNIVAQLHKAGKRLVHLGDNTWAKLFPDHFLPHLSRAHDSFLISDLDTVDNDVEKHLLPLISSLQDEWDVIFGHFLGVDHVGHRYGPAHPEMTRKLNQMDRVIRELMDSLDDNTLLVVMGDHGMDAHGNHGGESENEVQAALWMYTRRKHFGHLSLDPQDPVSYINKRSIPQIDLVPTLSLLLGLPIPFNSLGSPIEEAFIGPTGNDWRQLVHSQMLSFAQVKQFHREYTSRTLNTLHVSEHSSDLARNFPLQELDFQDRSSLRILSQQLRDHQNMILQHYKRIWAQFSIPHMLEGLMILAFSAIAMFLEVCTCDRYRFTPRASSGMVKVGAATAMVSCVFHVTLTGPGDYGMIEGVILGIVISSFMLLGRGSCLPGLVRISTNPPKLGIWNALAIGFTILLAIGFASNSYTVWEDRIVLTFLATFGICALSASHRTVSKEKNTTGPLLAISFGILARLVSLSRYCREEQLSFCVTTYRRFGDATGWWLLIPYLIAILVPVVTRIALGSELVSHNLALWAWCHFGMPIALFFTAVYWTLDSSSKIGWVEGGNFTILSNVPRAFFSRFTLVIAIAGSAVALTSKWTMSMTSVQCNMVIATSILVISILVCGPMGGGSLSILYLQILSLRKMINHSRNSTIGPTITALLGSLHFFGTGHNATFSSIQWEAAYILSQDLHYPWSPLLVFLNTFAGPIVTAFSTPLIIPHDEHSQGIDLIARSFAVHILVYTVWTLSTGVWASILRRHLMLFAIFCPRFLMAGALLLTIDIIAILVSLATGLHSE